MRLVVSHSGEITEGNTINVKTSMRDPGYSLRACQYYLNALNSECVDVMVLVEPGMVTSSHLVDHVIETWWVRCDRATNLRVSG